MIRESKTEQAESRGNLLTMPKRRLFSPCDGKGNRCYNGEITHQNITAK